MGPAWRRRMLVGGIYSPRGLYTGPSGIGGMGPKILILGPPGAAVGTFAGEIIEPRRTVPLAIAASILTVTVLYAFVIVAMVNSPVPADVIAREGETASRTSTPRRSPRRRSRRDSFRPPRRTAGSCSSVRPGPGGCGGGSSAGRPTRSSGAPSGWDCRSSSSPRAAASTAGSRTTPIRCIDGSGAFSPTATRPAAKSTTRGAASGPAPTAARGDRFHSASGSRVTARYGT